MFKLEKLSIQLGGKTILNNVSLALEDNDNLVILGANGAGKTVLLRCLSGNLAPSEGSVHFNDQDLYSGKTHELKKQIGFISPALFDDYDFNSTVSSVVKSGLFGSIGICQDPTKVNNQVVKNYINQVIDQKYPNIEEDVKKVLSEFFDNDADVDEFMSRPFGKLSYGQKVRCLLARALMTAPKIIILDEPTTGLDPRGRILIKRLAKKLADKYQLIYVTHHFDEIMPCMNKVLMLKAGKIFAFGDCAEKVNDKQLCKLYGVENGELKMG
jgi:iron complex transport system ATP-binding protein